MLYYLFEYLEKEFQLPGAGLFQFISFPSYCNHLFFIGLIDFGKRIDSAIESISDGGKHSRSGLAGQKEKAETPTMGGLIIILATLTPVLLFAKLDNIYILLLIITTLWMGSIGFIDDYIKIKRKDKEGLKRSLKSLVRLDWALL